MDSRRFFFYIQEAETQTALARMAADDLELAIANHQKDRLWFSLYAFLSAAGRLSRLLWPKHPGPLSQVLKASYGIGDDSPLKSRALRDVFEHFGERVDRWARTSRGQTMHDQVIDWRGTGRPSIGSTFRYFNVPDRTAGYLGGKLDLRPMIEEIRKMDGKFYVNPLNQDTTTFAAVVPARQLDADVVAAIEQFHGSMEKAQ